MLLAVLALSAGILLHTQHDWLIGLPVTHADYARELNATLGLGTFFFAIGVTILGFCALMWLCDYLEPTYRELFGDGRFAVPSDEESVDAKEACHELRKI